MSPPAFLRFVLGAAAVAAGGLLTPFLRNASIIPVVLVLLLGITFAFRQAGDRISRRLLDRTPWLGAIVLSIAAIVVTFGSLEYAARLAADLHLVARYQAMQTQLPKGTDDWRLAHITADAHRQPDPVLWWRPVAQAPYNAQGFKGPEVNPADRASIRVICYGDSNTDGPDSGGWVQRLSETLERSDGRVEVLNAGVGGYSSHQGLLRFQQEVAEFAPDIVLFSFGWNDAVTTPAPPDAAFQPPPPAAAAFQRLLLRYKFYLVLLNWIRPSVQAASDRVQPRVSLAEYVRNAETFADVANKEGTKPVLLTRPHRESPAELRKMVNNWRSRVPDYNDALRAFARSNNVPLIDAQAHFAGARDQFVDECHFTDDGHRRMAVFVRDELVRLALIPR